MYIKKDGELKMGFTIKEYVGYDMVKELRQSVNKNKKRPTKRMNAVNKKNGKTKQQQK